MPEVKLSKKIKHRHIDCILGFEEKIGKILPISVSSQFTLTVEI